MYIHIYTYMHIYIYIHTYVYMYIGNELEQLLRVSISNNQYIKTADDKTVPSGNYTRYF
jgi:hypothetical protein